LESYYFLGVHAKVQKPAITPSERKVMQGEREKEKQV
jgi:hypothetical protein